jgi:hypothetical protein
MEPLPARAATLLADVHAPPRLVAHLTLVHDVATQLVAAFRTRWPALAFDADAVCFGAATHDIGKAKHVAELSGPGSLHEDDGRRLLEERGVEPALARFAATHAQWSAQSPLEDLLVSLADAVWKGKRRGELEDLVVARIASAAGVETWRAFTELDDVLGAVAAGADARIEWQNRHPVR